MASAEQFSVAPDSGVSLGNRKLTVSIFKLTSAYINSTDASVQYDVNTRPGEGLKTVHSGGGHLISPHAISTPARARKIKRGSFKNGDKLFPVTFIHSLACGMSIRFIYIYYTINCRLTSPPSGS